MHSKVITLIIALLAFASPLFAEESGVNFVEGKTFAEVLAQAKQENKLVFVDCYTSWCGPCKMMATKVFPQKVMGDYFNPKFVSVKIDMEKGEGVDLKKKFEVAAFPTFVILDGDGNELHRIVGGDQDCQKFIDRVNTVFSGNSLAALSKRYENGERDIDFMLQLLNALDEAYDRSGSDKIAAELLNVKPEELLSNEKLFKVFAKHDNDLFSPNFQYFLANRDRFASQYDKETVDRKATFIWQIAPRFFVIEQPDGTRTVEKGIMDRYKAELKKWNVPDSKKLISDAEITVAMRTGDWTGFAKYCDNYIKKYETSDAEIYNWVRTLTANTQDPGYRKMAIKWIEKRLAFMEKRDAKPQAPGMAMSMVNGPQFKKVFEDQLAQLKAEVEKK